MGDLGWPGCRFQAFHSAKHALDAVVGQPDRSTSD